MDKLIDRYFHQITVGHPHYSDRLDLWNRSEDGQQSSWFGAIIKDGDEWRPLGGVTEEMAKELAPMMSWFSSHAKD